MVYTIRPEHVLNVLNTHEGVIVGTADGILVGSRLAEAGDALKAGGRLLADAADVEEVVRLVPGGAVDVTAERLTAIVNA